MTAPASLNDTDDIRSVRKSPAATALEGATLAFAASVKAPRTLRDHGGRQGALMAATLANSDSQQKRIPRSTSRSMEPHGPQLKALARSRSSSGIAAALATAQADAKGNRLTKAKPSTPATTARDDARLDADQAPDIDSTTIPTKLLIKRFELNADLQDGRSGIKGPTIARQASQAAYTVGIKRNGVGVEELPTPQIMSSHIEKSSGLNPLSSKHHTLLAGESLGQVNPLASENARKDWSTEQPAQADHLPLPKQVVKSEGEDHASLKSSRRASVALNKQHAEAESSSRRLTSSKPRTVSPLGTQKNDRRISTEATVASRRMSSTTGASAESESSPIGDAELHSPLPYKPLQSQGSSSRIFSHMNGDALANAIVASNLAGSRASAINIPPTPPRRRHHHESSPGSPVSTLLKTPYISRSPSPSTTSCPAGRLRQTMRREPSSSSSSDNDVRKHKRASHMVHKHPNKYHEGSRKRWRNLVTDIERKRYEGLWAANKGLYLQHGSPLGLPTPPNSETGLYRDDVINLVVRDIWLRSRLPDLVLQEIWDLVDERMIGSLNREAFVVGLWLIDQSLKGRKLPPKVSQSVWDSVRGVGTRIRR